MTQHKLAIDIGGTFIDVVTFDFAGRQLDAFKLPTVPDDPAAGVIAAVGRLPIPVEGISEFVHGTTLGLNAILERKGTTVGIITNKGFRDLFEIGRGSLDFGDMYRFDYEKAPQIVERRNIRGVEGRINFQGDEVEPLDTAGVLAAVGELREGGCNAIAISFLHSYANDSHERQAVALIREHYPALEVSAGSLLAKEYREYERTSTAVLDAYIKPVLKNYLGRLSAGMAPEGFAGKKYVMNSAGGALTFDLAETQPIATVLSGPAGGVSGALYVAKATERRNVLSIDVGGTSLDACLILDYQPVDVFEARIDTFPVLQPIFDLRTLGAGGGSIAWVDNRLLRVGPESAGAEPGPACYGRGGRHATVTDAALVLGYIDTTNFMGGEMQIAHDLAVAALEENICDKLDISVEDAARSVIDVLVSRTSSSIKEMMLERGLDPTDFSMLAFGGCGPLLGPMLQNEMEMPELVVPPLPSVFSAWGMMASDLSFSDAMSVLETVSNDALAKMRRLSSELRDRSMNELDRDIGDQTEIAASFSARLRFIGQEHTLSIPYHEDDTPERLFDRFSDAHLERFGHTFESEAEIVSLMIKLVAVTEKPDVAAQARAALADGQSVPHRMFDQAQGVFVDCRKMRRDSLKPGERYRGPMLVSDDGSSLAVHGNQELIVDGHGMMCVTRTGG